MNKEEKQAMKEGFDLCLTRILALEVVTEKLIGCLHRELGTKLASDLLNEIFDDHQRHNLLRIQLRNVLDDREGDDG